MLDGLPCKGGVLFDEGWDDYWSDGDGVVPSAVGESA